jgi:DNA-binding HxlR family transcriptional regulator
MGATLLETIQQLMDWADSHAGDIYEARQVYDAQRVPDEAPCPDDDVPCDG